MSSRALRKLRREQEEKNRLTKLQENQGISEDDSDSGGVGTSYAITAKMNAFDMLNATGEDSNNEEVTQDGQQSAQSSEVDEVASKQQQDAQTSTQAMSETQPHAKRKTKSKKKKKKPQQTQTKEIQPHQLETKTEKTALDEIDLALLSLKGKNPEANGQEDGDHHPSKELLRLYTLLATNVKDLNALNEMKKLFGNVVLGEENQEAAAPAQGRRRDRRQQNDLGGALAARNSPVSRGKGLSGLALRRNVFMVGKESWPKATSGGLSMEVVERPWDMTTEYRFVHNKTYQDAQHQFYTCTQSLDPQRIIQLLQFNPYHISTLLIVSDITEQQGDHTASGEMLERALFSYGRSVHSTFPTSIAEGKARMDFRLVENREFWLVAWRYIIHLGQRGTWRTAYEWAKLLLSLDPEGDPYCIRLILDQLALRGGQSENFVEMAVLLDSLFAWGRNSPNVQISLGLAQYRLKRAEPCRAVLRSAVEKYPWVFLRLFQELNIASIPNVIWGKLPQSDHDKLETETYVTRAKDLWNTPEAIALLVEVVESVEEDVLLKGPDVPISRSEARHIMLSEIPSLISILPREFTTATTSSIDVLPPLDSYTTYHYTDSGEDDSDEDDSEPQAREPPARARTRPPQEGGVSQEEIHEEAIELSAVQRLFTRFLPFLANRGGTLNAMPTVPTEEEIQQAVDIVGMTPAEFVQRTDRLFQLHAQSMAQLGDDSRQEESEDDEMPALEPASDNDVEAVQEAAAAPEATAVQEAVAAEEDRRRTELQTVPLNSHVDNAMDELNRRLEVAAALPGYPGNLWTLNSHPQPQGSTPPTNPLRSQTSSPPQTASEPEIPSGSRPASGPYIDTSTRPHLPPTAPELLNSQLQSDYLVPNEPYDENRNKHWLAGRGIRLVQAFIHIYGSNELTWLPLQECLHNNPVIEYARRLKLLNEQTRNFFIKYVLQQQIDTQARDMVKRFLGFEDVLALGTGGYRETHRF